MIRIAIVLPNLQGGGAERVVSLLLQRLDRSVFEPFLVVGRRRGIFSEALPHDLAVMELGSESIRAASWKMMRMLRHIQPDLVFGTLGWGAAAASLRTMLPRKTRFVSRLANSLGSYLDEVARTSVGRSEAIRFFNRIAYERSDLTICQSDYMVQDASEQLEVDGRKFTRIYNPVDVSHVRSQAADDGASLPDYPYIVSVGNLHWRKGYDLLLPAFRRASMSRPDLRLVILGEGLQRPVLEGLVDDLGLHERVLLPGFDDNPHRWLAGAKFFVSSSRYEGFSNAILESLAAGTPVLATDCPSGNREVIEEGHNGWLVPVSVDGLAEGLERADESAGLVKGMSSGWGIDARFGLSTITSTYEKTLLQVMHP